MLDLNRLLLFIAWLSPVVVLVRTWQRAEFNRSWRLAAAAVLIITAVACWFAFRFAGYIGGVSWLVLLFLPAVGLRKAATLAAEERFAHARKILGLLRFLHPARAVREEAALLRALELAHRGAIDSANEQLARLAPNESRAGRRAIAESFRIRGDWAGLLAWCRQNIPRLGLGEDPGLLPLFFRSLGETGARDELALQFAGRASALLASPLQEATYLSSLTLLLAFSGRTEALRDLFQERFSGLKEETQEFWIATSQMCGGNAADARACLLRLRELTSDAVLRRDIAQRLADAALPTEPLSRASIETAERFARWVPRTRGGLLAPSTTSITPAVACFIGLNIVMFILEIALGGTTSDFVLYKLGALEPFSVFAGHQYWRLLACLFLHFGIFHLSVNLYALYILGPTLEATVGWFRFALAYLLSGIGSSLGVLLLWRIGWTQANFLVGASGCVMGLVGAWAGLLLRHRHAPMARRRLTSIGIIVLMQTAFDFVTPQVSMGAHLSGLTTGLLVGLLIFGEAKV